MTLSKEDITYCDQAVELEQECSAGARPGPGDHCIRCQHTRGVHAPHCRIEKGCDCEEFVERQLSFLGGAR